MVFVLYQAIASIVTVSTIFMEFFVNLINVLKILAKMVQFVNLSAILLNVNADLDILVKNVIKRSVQNTTTVPVKMMENVWLLKERICKVVKN